MMRCEGAMAPLSFAAYGTISSGRRMSSGRRLGGRTISSAAAGLTSATGETRWLCAAGGGHAGMVVDGAGSRWKSRLPMRFSRGSSAGTVVTVAIGGAVGLALGVSANEITGGFIGSGGFTVTGGTTGMVGIVLTGVGGVVTGGSGVGI